MKTLLKIIIFGNSGAGKSTLAKRLCQQHELAHLDLDSVAWLPTTPPERRSIPDSLVLIEQFLAQHRSWVIEGCYADLLGLVAPKSTQLIFLNLPIEKCIANAKARPWEPHKYESKEAQDANLDMLLGWIADYAIRTDAFSQQAHLELYENFLGEKLMITSNLAVEQIKSLVEP